MFKKLLFIAGMFALSCSCFAQTLTKLGEEEAVPLYGLSSNGRFAYGMIQDVGVYMYDLSTKEMTFVEGSYTVDGVSNNGIYAGGQTVSEVVDDMTVQIELPVYYKSGECIQLPLPPAGSKYTDGTARGVNADGSIIVGYVNMTGNTKRIPCIWTLQTGGSYAIQLLPTYEKDLSDRKPQAVDALRCSDAGDLIVGRLVDWTGYLELIVTWTKNSEQGWDLKMVGKDVLFEEGAVIPSIPDPELNAMLYFTAEDSVAYNKALKDYAAGLISENPAWDQQKYITNLDSIAKYNIAAAEYNEIMKIVEQKTAEMMSYTTGKFLDVYSISMSRNGKYVGSTCMWADPNGGGEPGPLMKGAKANGTISAPICFDLEAGNWDVKDFIEDGIVNGIADSGDIFFATPNMEKTRTSYVIPAGTKNMVNVAEWVKQKTNGAIDMKPEFSFSYEYMDRLTGQQVVVKDSLIVGDVVPSANGRILLGTFFSPIAEGPAIITYYVDMDNFLTGVENVTGDAGVSVYPNPATDVLYIKGNAENVSVVDLTGRKVYESSTVTGTIPVGTFGEGTYLVKVKADGKVTTHKVFVK